MDFRRNFSNEQEIDEYISSLSRKQLEEYMRQHLKFYIQEIPDVEFKKDSFGELIKYICFEKYIHKVYFSECKVEVYNNVKPRQLLFSYAFVPGKKEFDKIVESYAEYIHCIIEDYVEERDENFNCGVYKVILR